MVGTLILVTRSQAFDASRVGRKPLIEEWRVLEIDVELLVGAIISN